MEMQVATDQNFEQLLKDHPRVIVKYYADWCGACKMLAPKYKRIAAEEANANVLFLDINAEHNESARKLAGVSNLPFLAAFKNGALVEGAAASKEEYLRKLIDLTA
jgi:thioredoxin-like negative regulator of GroEL